MGKRGCIVNTHQIARRGRRAEVHGTETIFKSVRVHDVLKGDSIRAKNTPVSVAEGGGRTLHTRNKHSSEQGERGGQCGNLSSSELSLGVVGSCVVAVALIIRVVLKEKHSESLCKSS